MICDLLVSSNWYFFMIFHDLMVQGSFQMKVGTSMIQRNLMIPGIWWSQVFDDLKEISIGRMDFHNPKVYGDTSISDGLAFLCQFQCFWQIFVLPHLVQPIIIARTHEHHKYVTSLLPEWRGGKVGCFPPKRYLCFIQLPSISANITVVLIFIGRAHTICCPGHSRSRNTHSKGCTCFCRSLIKVKFSTDQFRPALGSGCCRLSPCSKNLKTALSQTFSTWHPNTFCPYCLILT